MVRGQIKWYSKGLRGQQQQSWAWEFKVTGWGALFVRHSTYQDELGGNDLF